MTPRAAVGRRNTTVCVTPMMLLEKLLNRKCIIIENTNESPLALSSRGVLKRGRGKQISLPAGFKFSQIHTLISLPLPVFLSVFVSDYFLLHQVHFV